MEIGYALSSEEHPAPELVQFACRAETAGFAFALISDHYHPWIDRQGHSPFVWSVLGAIGQATRRLRVGTGVTCPLRRIHPAIIAQAAATVATLMPGRFFLGVGSGENLNEHIVGGHWPPAAVRLEMLEEAIEVIRSLWSGELVNHRGTYYTVEDARLYSRPDEPSSIMIAAGGKESAALAGRVGDGLIATTPSAKLIDAFATAGGKRKPRYAQIAVCWAEDERQARRTAREWWPTAALGGNLPWEVKTPALFEQAVACVREEDVAEKIICGPDPRRHVDALRKFAEAGYDRVYIHQIGPDQEGFFRFAERELLPVAREW
jgi:G6PDH family F420-dependent oxidoreductase